MKRAKYLDWCSAQVADHFIALSPDEIFELAERAAENPEESGRSLSASGGPGANVEDDWSSYRLVVERVTEVLARQLELPDFEGWLELYARDPKSVESQLIGFWKEGV